MFRTPAIIVHLQRVDILKEIVDNNFPTISSTQQTSIRLLMS